MMIHKTTFSGVKGKEKKQCTMLNTNISMQLQSKLCNGYKCRELSIIYFSYTGSWTIIMRTSYQNYI